MDIVATARERDPFYSKGRDTTIGRRGRRALGSRTVVSIGPALTEWTELVSLQRAAEVVSTSTSNVCSATAPLNGREATEVAVSLTG